MIAKGQTGPINMRWQSTWPSKDIFHEFALDFAKRVNDMTGGELKIEVLPAGAVVPAFGLLDAVSKGTLDGGHRRARLSLRQAERAGAVGLGPAFGMDANMLLAWHKYGGGKQLLEKLYNSISANVVSFPYGPMATQPLGWFKKPITKMEDFKGMKFPARSASRSTCSPAWVQRSTRCPAARSCRRWTGGSSTAPSSTMPAPTGCSAFRTSPRCACCRATTRTPSSSRSCSTRPSTTRCRPR